MKKRGCPLVGAKGKATNGQPTATCAGWHFEQPVTWQLRKIRDHAHLLGDLDNKSAIILAVMDEFKRTRAYADAKARKAKADEAAKKERSANGKTR